MTFRYPLASPGIFWTVQGEGFQLGTPMRFIRLGGCSVGCEGCDTNYRVSDRLTASEIAAAVSGLPLAPWTWVTGGEPADYDLGPLLEELEGSIALVTSGRKELRGSQGRINFLSVSPHGSPEKLAITRGSQVNLVPGLGGTRLEDWADYDFSGFEHRWVTPLAGDAESLSSCLKWLLVHPGWKLGVQAHKTWGIA